MSLESPKFETKIGTELKPDKKSEFLPNREEIFKNWQELVVGEKKESDIDMDKLDDEQFKDLLSKRIEERLDETTKILGLNTDEKLIKRMNEAKIKEEKAEVQEEVIKSVAKQINSIPVGKWAFTPREIEREKKLNCSGAALICGSMLNKIGIKTEYGSPANHAMNFAELADGSLLYVDSRNNIVKKIETEEENFKGVKIRKIDDENIEYKIVPYFPQRDAIKPIFNNIKSLKIEAQKEDSKDKDAKEIYRKDKKMVDSVDYFKLGEELYPDLNDFRQTKEWQEEEKRINKLHGPDDNLLRIKERFEVLTQKEQKRLIKETNKKKEFIREFLLSDAKVKSKLSKSLFGFFSDIKNELVPLKNWNEEEYEKFIGNLIDRTVIEERPEKDIDEEEEKDLT